MYVILLLEFTSSAQACWIQVGFASLHEVQSGQHSMQLFDVMCASIGVLAVAVKVKTACLSWTCAKIEVHSTSPMSGIALLTRLYDVQAWW